MPCPHYPVLLDHQLLSSSLGSIKQPHVDKLYVSVGSSLPVDDVIIGYRVSGQVKVYFFPSNVKCQVLDVVLELEQKNEKTSCNYSVIKGEQGL